MKDISSRSKEMNSLINDFWAAVSNHVDRRDPRDEAVTRFEKFTDHIQSAENISLKKVYASARRHIKYSVNDSGQVFRTVIHYRRKYFTSVRPSRIIAREIICLRTTP